MDGISSAASIITLAGVGVQIAIKLATLATQISTASERVTSIGDEISLTSIVLRQLGELMDQKTNNDSAGIFSKGGLDTTRMSAAICERIFRELEKEAGKASEQIRGSKRLKGGRVKLSNAEKAKWPFLQPGIESLRADLREAKGTLMLMLLVTSLALSQRMADVDRSTISDFKRAIVALPQVQRKQKTLSEGLPPEEEVFGSDSDRSGSEVKEKLKVFLLKPIVRDFFDRIELTWSVQNPKMDDLAIRKYIAKNEDDGIPSVLDTTQTLDEYERTVIDSKIYDRSSGAKRLLLSLKRTKTQILHRNITIKDIPGLQFVVQREMYPPKIPSWNRGQGMPSYAMSPPSLPQPILPLTTSCVNKRQKSIDSRGKEPTRKGFSHSSCPRPPGDLVPQIPDQDTTDYELLKVPLATRAEISDKSPNPNGQYTSYVGSKPSFRGPKEGPDYQQDISIPTDQRARMTASLNTEIGSSAPSNSPQLASHEMQAKPSMRDSPSEERAPHEPFYLSTDTYQAIPENDSTILPGSIKPKLRKRGIIKRGSLDKIVEVQNSRFVTPNHLKRWASTDSDSDLHSPTREISFYSSGEDSEEDFVTHPRIFDCTAIPEAAPRLDRSSSPASTSSEIGSPMWDKRIPVYRPPLEESDDSADSAPSAIPTQQGHPLGTAEPDSLEGSETDSSSEEEEGYTLEDMDAVVDELLGKYTTLFDSTVEVDMRDQ